MIANQVQNTRENQPDSANNVALHFPPGAAPILGKPGDFAEMELEIVIRLSKTSLAKGFKSARIVLFCENKQ